MVKTRSALQRENKMDATDAAVSRQIQNPTIPRTDTAVSQNIVHDSPKTDRTAVFMGGSTKTESHPLPPPSPASRSYKSKRSTSSVFARIKKLELEAAQQKAKIQMQLIDKKLAADMAELEYSSHDEGHTDTDPDIEVEKWLDKTQQDQQRTHDHGTKPGELNPPPALASDVAGAADGTIHMLVSAIKDLATASASASAPREPNSNLLSRICTPKELPAFSGDPLEWLHFKLAYEESTEVCGFSPKENLWRLRKCLHGPAKEAVTALLIGSTSPDLVMSTLELRFGNPDIIISKIMQDIKKLQPMSTEYHKDIVQFSVKVNNVIAAVRAVGQGEYLQGMSIATIVLSKLPTILIAKWSDYSYPLIREGKKARLEILSEFLHEEAVKISTTSISLSLGGISDRLNTYRQTGNNATVLVQSEVSDKCLYCRTSRHVLTQCKQFKRALRRNRWQHVKRHGICYKCLVSRHDCETCPAPACDKDGCGAAHHRLLHYKVSHERAPAGLAPGGVNRPLPPPEHLPTEDSVSTVTHIQGNNNCKVLLKVVPIKVHGPNGAIESYALLDDGSTVSLISAELAARAGLRGRSETMRVRGAWDDSELVVQATIMTLNVSGVTSNKQYTINARSVNNLNLPKQNASVVNCDYYENLQKLKDKLFCDSECKPEVLLGQDNYHLLVPLDVSLGKPNEPSATLTPLGWCVHGSVRVERRSSAGAASRSAAAASRSAAAAHATMLLVDAHDSDRELQALHDEVRHYFAIESLGIQGKPRLNKDDERARSILDRTAKLIDGRWSVGLPWKDDNCKMPDSYPHALSRLKSVEKKIAADAQYGERYVERVNHLFENDFAHELTDTQPTAKTWYLPHFGVDNPNKKKLRLVFDAAAKTNGLSLNDYLLTGPDLLNSLFGIVVRFRENKIAVAGDIKDMFLRVKIRPEDQNALRFLWKNNSSLRTYAMTSLIFGANCSPFIAQYIKNLNALRFQSAMPSAVAAVVSQHYMDDYLDSLPDEPTAIEMVNNVANIHKQGGFEIRNWTSNSKAVLESVPNESLGTAAIRFKVGQQYEGERTLGLMWYPGEDELGFDLSLKKIPSDVMTGERKPSKRLILKVVMSIFDVFGFLAPVTIQGKIILQDAWRLNIGWDESVPDEIFSKWREWIHLLKGVSNIRIPRCYQSTVTVNLDNPMQAVAPHTTRAFPAAPACQRPPLATHASPHPLHVPSAGLDQLLVPPACPNPLPAAGACPPHTATAAPHTPLACPRPRSAPPVTLATPLKAAAQPDNNICAVPPSGVDSAMVGTNYKNLQLHVFSDASTKAFSAVAYWRWTDYNGEIKVTFIASKCRVAPVKRTTVPRLELQAALLAVRLADTITSEHKLRPEVRYFWCDSTTVLHWISNDARNYKTFVANRLGEIDELTCIQEWRYVPTRFNVADAATREVFNYDVFTNEWINGPTFLHFDESSWPHHILNPEKIDNLECINLIRSSPEYLPVPDPDRFSSWLRLLRSTAVVLKFIDKCKKLTNDCAVDCNTMVRAEHLLLRHAQAESFGGEIAAIKTGKSLQENSRIVSLSPYLDQHGVLRSGGRIDAATDVEPEIKRPAILDGHHHVTKLIVRHFHIRAAHGSREAVVNDLKQKYWIIRLRPTVKNVASKCMFCRIKCAKPENPRMGDLPAARVAHHHRPFTFCGVDLFGPMKATVGRSRLKRYGVIFTCLTVRAVHLELVHSLTTDSFIMALRRMAARRGWPRHMFSDNGTNLRGADTELKKSILELDQGLLRQEAVNNAAEWTFIPPASPHWGGAWERLVRSVKTSLKVILKERAPKDETLLTLMAEVENIVNSRPLMHVSVEPGSNESLTPNHFLIGASSNLSVPGTFDDSDLYLRKQWRKAQRLTDMFWGRWVREVLPDLLPRKKWTQEQRPLQVGDLVLMVEPSAPRNIWQKGIVQSVFPGKDGRVRLVEVKTESSTFKRSASRVARIPVADEC